MEALRAEPHGICHLPRSHWEWSDGETESGEDGSTTVNTALKTGKVKTVKD